MKAKPKANPPARVYDNPEPWCVVLTKSGQVMWQCRTRRTAERGAANERRNGWAAHVAKLVRPPCR